MAQEKTITLSNIEQLITHLERKIPTMTMEEYKAGTTSIAKGTFFVITDDSVQASAMVSNYVSDDDVTSLVNSDTSSSTDTNVDDLFS